MSTKHAAARAENARLRAALKEVRDVLADSCPAWALEWDQIRTLPGWSDDEVFSTQEVRDAARAVIEPIAAVVFDALGPVP